MCSIQIRGFGILTMVYYPYLVVRSKYMPFRSPLVVQLILQLQRTTLFTAVITVERPIRVIISSIPSLSTYQSQYIFLAHDMCRVSIKMLHMLRVFIGREFLPLEKIDTIALINVGFIKRGQISVALYWWQIATWCSKSRMTWFACRPSVFPPYHSQTCYLHLPRLAS